MSGSYEDHYVPESRFTVGSRPNSVPSYGHIFGSSTDTATQGMLWEKKETKRSLKDFIRMTDTNSLSVVNAGLFCLDELMGELTEQQRGQIFTLDVTGNRIQDLQGISCMFPELRQLVVDGNAVARIGQDVSQLKHLQTLWLNKNLLGDLDAVLAALSDSRKLLYLSLLGNPCCKHGVGVVDGEQGASHEESEWYRSYVVHNLPTLLFLDEREVTRGERQFFSGTQLSYDFVWVKLRQIGWGKGAATYLQDDLAEVTVWEVTADSVDVQRDSNPGSDRITTMKKGSVCAVVSATVSHGRPRLQVTCGTGVPPRGWITPKRGSLNLIVQKRFRTKKSELRPLQGSEALKLLGSEVLAVVKKHAEEGWGDVLHNRLKVLYHREYGPKAPALRAQREELGLQDIPALLGELPAMTPDLHAERERGPDGGWFWILRIKSDKAVEEQPPDWTRLCPGCTKCKQWAADLKTWEERLQARERALIQRESTPAPSSGSQTGHEDNTQVSDDESSWSHNPYNPPSDPSLQWTNSNSRGSERAPPPQ